jgi:hypothetical protein
MARSARSSSASSTLSTSPRPAADARLAYLAHRFAETMGEGALVYGLRETAGERSNLALLVRDFLYHVKEGGGAPVVYSVSARRPNESNALWRVEAREFAPKLREGMRLGSLLRANPVRMREGKRHDVVMEEKHRPRDQGVPKTDWPAEAELVQEAGAKRLGTELGKGSHEQTSLADAIR